MIQLPQRNFMLAKFYFLVNLREEEEEAAWLSCKLILLSLHWLPSSCPRGCGWVCLPQLSIAATHSTWAADVSGLCARMLSLYHLGRFNRCGSISGGDFDKHTCGLDHLLSATSTFLWLAVSGNNVLLCICSVWERKWCTTLQKLLWHNSLIHWLRIAMFTSDTQLWVKSERHHSHNASMIMVMCNVYHVTCLSCVISPKVPISTKRAKCSQWVIFILQVSGS